MQVSKAHPILRAILVGAAAFTLVSVGGCATDGDVGATFDPLTPFPATAVWAWDDAQNKLPADDRIDGEALDRNIRSAVAAEFAKKGYSEGTGKVQYRFSYEVGIHTWMSRTEARAFGTLSVLLTEAASGRKVWLGFVRMEIDMSLTPDQRSERLRGMLAGMLENFPPAQPE